MKKIRFKKDLLRLGKNFLNYLSECEYKKFIVEYNRWMDGGFIGIIQDIAKDYYKDYFNEVIIATNEEGVKELIKAYVGYILEAETWTKKDKWGYKVNDNGNFELWLYSPYYGYEKLIIKNI